MNKKHPSERKNHLYKTTVPEWMAKMVDALAHEAGGIARFFRKQILIAWQARHGEVLVVPVAGGPQPAYVCTAMVDGNGRKVAAKLADNLVAVSYAQFSLWQETNRFFHLAVAANHALTSKLREKDDLIQSMLEVKEEFTNQRKYYLDIGDYPCKQSLEESKEEARQALQLWEWRKQAAAIREHHENLQ